MVRMVTVDVLIVCLEFESLSVDVFSRWFL